MGVILDYLAQLKNELMQLPLSHSTAFAVWCSDRMVAAFSGSLRARIGDDNVKLLREVLDALWASAIGSASIDRTSLDAYRSRLIELDWDRGDDMDELDPEEEIEDIGAEETLEAIVAAINMMRLSQQEVAARAAESILNKINAELDFRHEISDSSSHPLMAAEIEYQTKLIDLLRTQPALTRTPPLTPP